MFNFSWSEIALIAVVALVAIGPKDMPAALKTVAQLVKKARGMAAEFQTHVNDLMREADLEDVRKHIDEIRNFDIKGTVERAIDPDQSLRRTFTEDPFAPASAATAYSPESFTATGPIPEGPLPDGDTAVLERTETVGEAPSQGQGWSAHQETGEGATEAAPAFVPPAVAAAVMHPPAFVPPDLLGRRS
ncbi:MAG TPA: Sec-independent protein translocase protein TatB [Acetobacteraceae bacterium]|jgi:sec-independent protein translocase protein TatB|nr:Sec-independent protein translocase protein TatB [Acetobacteraceae bacterium]